MSYPHPQPTLAMPDPTMLSLEELALRWGRSARAVGLCSALGLGPRYIKLNGTLHYPFDEVQRYERERLMH